MSAVGYQTCSAQAFESLVERAPDAIARFDREFRHVYVNRAAERMTGLDRARLIGRTHRELGASASAGSHESWEALLRRCFDHPDEYTHEFAVDAPAGQRWFQVRVAPEPAADGAVRSVLAFTRDVTDLYAATRRSEERFRAFMDNSPALAFMRDEDGRYVYVSRAYRDRIFPAGRDCIGRAPADLFPPDVADRLRANDRAVLRGGHIQELIEDVPDRDGRVRHWLSHKFPFRDTDGRLYLAGITVDVTERAEAVRSLEESRERLASALLASRTGTFRRDIAANRLDADEELRKLVGCEGDEPLDTFEAWVARIHPDDRAAFGEQVRRCAREGIDFNFCYRVVRPDGTTRWIHDRARTFRDEQGRPTHVAGACVDVTDRRRYELALAESERFARATVDALTAHIAILDERGRILEVNRAWQRFAESNGLPYRHAGPGVDYLAVCDRAARDGNEAAAAAARAIRLALAGDGDGDGDGEDCYLEYPCHSPTEQRWFAMRVTRFAGGPPVRVVIAHEDITARHRADAMERERTTLRHAVGAMDHVLGVVGHELRTPLAALRAMSEFLLTPGAPQTAEFDTFLRGIHEESVRMADTVNNILEAARLNSGRARWNWSDVDVTEVCATAMESVGPVVDADAVRLTLRVEPPGLRMRGDADAIRRLVMNLLSNAQRHTARGAIEVVARELRDDTPGAAARRVRIEVRDTGAGIPEEIRSRLGEAFALNSGVVGGSHVAGSGLGLAICRGIVAAHGGEMTFTSVEGEGTTVRATLAADLAAPAAASETTAAAANWRVPA